MAKITSVEDLKRIKESAIEKIAVRLQGERMIHSIQIHVGMDDSGIEAGAKDLYNYMWNLALDKDIIVLQTAKIGDLKEPAVKVVFPTTKIATAFEEVSIDKANEIISEFVEKGATIEGMINTTYE